MFRPRTLLFAARLLALALTLGAAPARAEDSRTPPARRITDRGRIVLSGSVGGSWSNDSGIFGSLAQWSFHATPGALYFLRDRIGVGLALSGNASSTWVNYGRFRDYGFAAGVEAAFEAPLGARLGLLFRPFVGYLQQWSGYQLDASLLQCPPYYPGDSCPPFAGSGHAQVGYVRTWLSTQLLFHFSPGVALGAGPDVWVDTVVREQGTRLQGGNGSARVQVGLSVGLLIAL